MQAEPGRPAALAFGVNIQSSVQSSGTSRNCCGAQRGKGRLAMRPAQVSWVRSQSLTWHEAKVLLSCEVLIPSHSKPLAFALIWPRNGGLLCFFDTQPPARQSRRRQQCNRRRREIRGDCPLSKRDLGVAQKLGSKMEPWYMDR